MNPILTKNYTSGAAVAASRFVKIGAADNEVIQAVDSAVSIIGVSEQVGVSQADFDAGKKRIDVVHLGIACVELGGTVTRGDWLTADATGRGVAANLAAAGAIHVGGQAFVSGVVGDIILVRVQPIVVRSDSIISQVDVTLTAAQILALNATPIQIIAAPGAGKAIIVEDAQFMYDFVAAAYAGIAAGEDLALKYTNGSGAQILAVETTGFLDAVADEYRHALPGYAALGIEPVANAAVVAHMLTGEIITGDGLVKVRVRYYIADVAW